MTIQKFCKFLMSPNLIFIVILNICLFLEVNISFQQEIKTSHFKLNTPRINVDLLESKENLNASITLTKVRRGFFLDGDASDEWEIRWEPDIPCTFRYNTMPSSRILSNYPNTIQARGSGSLILNPAKEGIRTGVYYCILVSDDNPSVTSVEFTVIVQADAVPIAISPLGNINLQQGTPLFRWDPVEGVPYYFLLLSEGPLTIDRNEAGKVVGLTGINLTWQVITPSTFIKYGEQDPSGNFKNAHIPPLFQDIEYNWVVLNSYSESGDLISTEVAPVAPSFFQVTGQTLSEAPELIQPFNDEIITSNEIVFKWTPVPEVSRYRLFLYETREVSGSEVSYSMWSQVTNDTEINLKAEGFLVRTQYHWRVVAENQNGISTSEYRPFQYNASSGWVKFLVSSMEGPLSRVKFEVRNKANSKILVPFLTDTLGISKTLLPVGIYSFKASRPGFLSTPMTEFTVPDNDTVEVNVLLERSPSTVSGKVVDESGVGIFNVIVELRSGNIIETERTDQAGYFIFSIPSGNWTFRAYKLGYVISDFQNVSLLEDEALEMNPVTLHSATNIITGAVQFVEDNRPLQGAFVRAERGDITYETTTSRQGGFSFVLGPGTWKISLDSQGFYASPPEYTFDLNQNQQLSAPFQLFSGGLVYGKIIFQDRGLPDAQIKAFRKDTGELVQRAITNVQGDYSLGLPEGVFELVVFRENFLEVRKNITLSQGQTLVENFTLSEAGFVKGTVINLETFETVEGADIFALEDSTRRTTSNANGRYVFSLPPNIPYQIDAALPGFASTGPYSVTTSPGDTASQDIFLQALSGIIRGQVTDGFLPVREALVEIIDEGIQTFTDADGRFEFEISPGDYTISISKECYFSKTVSVNLVAGEIEELNIILKAFKSIITGKVTDTFGESIDAAEVLASGDTTFSTFTDFTGQYELCLNGGIYRIVASHLGYFPSDTTLVISDGDSIGNLNFKLQSNFAKVTGTVVDSSGRPMSNAFVTLTNANQTLIDTTETDGFYVIDKIYPGISEIQAFKNGFYGEKKVLNFLGQEQLNLDLTLYPADGFINGTVRDSLDSTGIADVSVRADFSEEPGNFFKTTTDESGSYTILNLPVVPNTKYTVFAFKEGFVSPQPINDVLPNTDGVDFYLIPKNAFISGMVQDRDTAEPIENARVEATNRKGSRSSAFTDSFGNFILTGLVPTESYSVTVTQNGFFTEVVQDVPAGSSAVVITLARRYALVMGRVVDFSTAEELENVPIEAIPDGLVGRLSSTVTDEFGEYLLRLIADNYIIQPVKTHHRSDPSFVQLQLSQGDTVTDVNFALEPQTVQSISIQRADQTEQPTISNLDMHCYVAFARDDKNRPVNIGTPNWKLNVSNKAAMIDSSGCVIFNHNYLGELKITATDPTSGVKGDLDIQVFAPIDSTTQTVLFDDRGLQMEFSKSTVLTKKEMLVSKVPLAPAKKGRAKFFTTDSSYIIKPAGLVFNKPVKLMLRPPPNTEGQEQFIAKWEATKSEWELLATTQKEKNISEANILETGEYIALAFSKSLTIENLSLLPNPFSPFQEIDGQLGLKIEFDISSNAAPNPLLTLKIYNLEGNLVRLLHDQTPFPRGHSTVFWDGKSDTGVLARNGRYLVRLFVEDPAERKEQMKSVVLIK